MTAENMAMENEGGKKLNWAQCQPKKIQTYIWFLRAMHRRSKIWHNPSVAAVKLSETFLECWFKTYILKQ